MRVAANDKRGSRLLQCFPHGRPAPLCIATIRTVVHDQQVERSAGQSFDFASEHLFLSPKRLAGAIANNPGQAANFQAIQLHSVSIQEVTLRLAQESLEVRN